MSKVIDYKDKYTFHPGYMLNDWIDDCGMTLEEFAERALLPVETVKLIVNGDIDISVDIGYKLTKVTGISADYWFRMQADYNVRVVEIMQDKDFEEEKRMYNKLDYSYFYDNYGLLLFKDDLKQRIEELRSILRVSSYSVLNRREIGVCFRTVADDLTDDMIFRANVLVQIAVNKSLRVEAPAYDEDAFLKAIDHVMELTDDPMTALETAREEFLSAGVIIQLLPDMKGTGILGAAKKVRNSRMLLVTDKHKTWDSFWFTLLHECHHILTLDDVADDGKADAFAMDTLIPEEEYRMFVREDDFSSSSVHQFAYEIHRDAGIVVGRLQYDGIVGYDNVELNHLKTKFDKKKAVGDVREYFLR